MVAPGFQEIASKYVGMGEMERQQRGGSSRKEEEKVEERQH